MRLGINGRFLAARLAGVQRFALETTRRLASRTEVVLFVPRGLGEAARRSVAGVRVDVGVFPGPLWEQVELPVRARRCAAEVLLHPANAAPVWGGPNVVVLHDLAPLTIPETFRLRYRLWVRLAHVMASRRARGLVTVSNWSADEIASLLPRDRGSITVVRQAPGPLDAPASPAAVEATRHRYGIRGSYFLAVTGEDTRKGESFLREVWQGWPDGAVPELVLVGGHFGWVHSGGDREAHEGILALGYVPDEDLRALYTGAVALLSASRLEGFGRPPLEAMACGTRVVTTPYGAAAEVLGGACESIPEDPALWRRTLAALMSEDPAARCERIRTGLQVASGTSWDDTAEVLLDACRRAAEGRS